MKLKQIVTERPINFADCHVSYKDVIVDAIEQICEHYNNIPELQEEVAAAFINGEIKVTDHHEACDNPVTFIATPAGSFLIHNGYENEYEEGAVTIFYYSISKIVEDAE